MNLNLKIATYKNAPILLHASIVSCFLFFISVYEVPSAIMAGVCFIVLMVAHEMGHAFYVVKYGHHLESIKIYPIHGVCEYSYDSERRLKILIFAGGLLVQFLLFWFFIALNYVLNILSLAEVILYIGPANTVFIQLNFLIFVLNILPIPGLDGFEIWKRSINKMYVIITKGYGKYTNKL